VYKVIWGKENYGVGNARSVGGGNRLDGRNYGMGISRDMKGMISIMIDKMDGGALTSCLYWLRTLSSVW
jgi:hypothetical protein